MEMTKFQLVFALICALIAFLGVGIACFGSEISIDMDAIATIESSNNPLAYNKHSGARGLHQITAICLDDYNACNRTEIALESLFDPEVNLVVAKWYFDVRIPHFLKHYGIDDTIPHRLWAYNAGIGKVRKNILPKETSLYIAKYYKAVAK